VTLAGARLSNSDAEMLRVRAEEGSECVLVAWRPIDTGVTSCLSHSLARKLLPN
jgi:hypothetical protein